MKIFVKNVYIRHPVAMAGFPLICTHRSVPKVLNVLLSRFCASILITFLLGFILYLFKFYYP